MRKLSWYLGWCCLKSVREELLRALGKVRKVRFLVDWEYVGGSGRRYVFIASEGC